MLSWSKGDDRVAIAQMNSELRNAQLELLSAQCATDRLRLRFSPEEVAHFGHRELVRKAVASATALYEYYGHVVRQIDDSSSAKPVQPIALSEENVQTAVSLVRQYLEEHRRKYLSQGLPLDAKQHIAMSAFFPCALLPGIRIVQNQTVPDPNFYAEARAIGVIGLPEMTHMASMTFEDVLVFPRGISDRRLFHALVHAVQFKVLGVPRYAELFVRSFLRTRNHANVPLETHAFALEAKFADNPAEAFSVEESVRLWVNQGRY
jgi:hypothetical protein